MSWPFVRTMIVRDLVTSTSDLAGQLVAGADFELPLGVWATHQTQGRGRATNRWWSGVGSLTFTVALDPTQHGLRLDHEPRVALATAVAVIDSLAPFGLSAPLGIRWPNDIEAAGRKLGGILPERVSTPRGAVLLIGVGINVAPQLDEAPPEIRRMATSLAELGGTAASSGSVPALLSAILSGLRPRLDELARDDPALAAQWSALDSLRGREVRVDLGPRTVTGVAHGIDAEGALCVAAEEGLLRLFGGRVLRD
jgi:BirA family biotin operon repressor/biotin-[acetyl-CoA-carboxylase] ligase